MSVEITNCLCCNAPYLNGAYLCDCYQSVEDDCKGCWNCKKHCICQPTIHPLDLPLAQVWQEAVKDEETSK